MLRNSSFKNVAISRIFYCSILISLFVSCSRQEGDHLIVSGGEANAVLVVPEDLCPLQQVALDDFRRTIMKASGAEIKLVSEDEMEGIPDKTVRIILGPSALTSTLGYPGENLLPEEFQITSKGKNIIVLARDIRNSGEDQKITNSAEELDSRVTSWAFSYLLDRYVGVRWLWPGELGTHIPEQEDILIPRLDVRYQQPIGRRTFNLIDPGPELLQWAAHHQVSGLRIPYKFRHSFRDGQDNGNWFNRFHESNPEYLAKNPDGIAARYNNREDRFKLCISNPDVAGQIIRDWETAGMPDFWDVTPNDGNGFCTCENCRDLDLKFGDVSYTREEIWTRPGHVVLTDRYVWFWNQLITRMRQKNPNAKIGVYFYSAYRNPPKRQKLEEGIVGVIVHGMDFSYWESWQEAGAGEIGLRPNWWHMGACGPNLPLRQVGNYIEKARDAGMVMLYMDTMMEYWPTQGPYFYLVARLVARPDLDTESIISEYCETFGSASAYIRKYLQFWEDYHKEVAYNIPAGGMLSQDPDGIYERVCREHFGGPQHPLRGHWKTLPYIYTEDILGEARQILDEADQAAAGEKTVLRINLLRDGLEWVEKAAAYMGAPEQGKEASLKLLAEFKKAMQGKYGYWNTKDIYMMKYWGIIGEEFDLSGM